MNGGQSSPAAAPPVWLSFPFANSIMGRVMSDKGQLKFAFFANLRVPMVLEQKIKRVVNNNWIKMRRLRGCCGDYGQPGC